MRLAFEHGSWCPTRDQFVGLLQRIQPEERQRVLSFVFRKDVRPALIGRALLRYAISQVTGITNTDIQLDRSTKGKPICKQLPAGSDINISHQGNYCVLAFDSSQKVGIDTMKIETHAQDLDAYFNLMNRVFSVSEWEFIRSVDGRRERLARFMRLWSLKEAYVKAEGFGITVDLQKIAFSCPTGHLSRDCLTTDTRLSVDAKLMSEWTFEESLIDEDHCVAVAVNRTMSPMSEQEAVTTRFRTITTNELIEGLVPLPDLCLNDLIPKWTDYCSKREGPGA